MSSLMTYFEILNMTFYFYVYEYVIIVITNLFMLNSRTQLQSGVDEDPEMASDLINKLSV